jgi:isocitrate dehydrogenase
MTYRHIRLPEQGQKISVDPQGRLRVPDHPVIGFLEGDGIGPDIMKASLRVWDAAVEKAYGGRRKIRWCELYMGEKAGRLYDGDFFPGETLEAIQDLRVVIKGPMTTPVGGGFRSLNVSLRQELDLYACVRPVRYFRNVPSPLVRPEQVDVVIFRENTEDVYAGIEYASGTPENEKLARFLREEMGARFFDAAGLGIKPISPHGSKRLVRKAIRYAIERGRESVTLVHKGNIMKFTEGAFRNWGYEVAREEFPDQTLTERELYEKYGGRQPKGKVIIQDRIADIIFQLLQLRPSEFHVLATMNLNGDYLSDAVAAEVGGVGIAPGANIGDHVAVFEATHGTAPKYANLNKANPGSLLFSGVMMLEYMGWNEAADLINGAYPEVIGDKTVTYDFARLMSGATLVSTSGFADALIAKISGNAADLAHVEAERRQAAEQDRRDREMRRVTSPLEAMRDTGRIPSTAGALMSRTISVPADADVDETLHRMRTQNISSIVVEPDASGLWGIMTQRDVVNKILGTNRSLRNVKVGDLASKPLISVSREATPVEIAKTLIASNIRRVVVLDKGKPVGIVSDTDLFRVVEEFGWTPEV